uniref:Transmembrane protein n=1 Tax=Haemonchus contortus TaxID=6289 RepID=A0A7I4Y975_HAECO
MLTSDNANNYGDVHNVAGHMTTDYGGQALVICGIYTYIAHDLNIRVIFVTVGILLPSPTIYHYLFSLQVNECRSAHSC